ncbi:MAG: dihydrofolate reductase [Flavobacteriales bacterium]|nr:dihydrofolate reductase [Flavobacteriales bacterium]
MKFRRLIAGAIVLSFVACAPTNGENNAAEAQDSTANHHDGDFKYTADRFADLRVIRYQIPGFDELDAGKKELLYYLYEAALAGRDIMYEQNYQHNLQLRKLFEKIVENEANLESDADYPKLLEYIKRFWFSNGIHHHYSNMKFEPEFSRTYFEGLLENMNEEDLPLKEGQSKADMIAQLSEVIFNPEIAPKKVNKDPDADIVATSAVNFYGEDVSQAEVETYYASLDKVEGNQPEYGLNTRLVKENGKIVAKTWKVGGLYSEAIEKIVYWLGKAATVAENDQQRETLERLIAYYNSGNVKDWDLYNIAWVNDTNSRTDVVNGFIEVYNDPLGYKGSFESVVSFKDLEATKRIEAVSKEAQWFEDNSPIMDEHKKESVKGITGKVITVVVESGDASPSTPIGINLPNNNWIRQEHGSKSVSLGNIVHAYEMSSKEGKSSLSEFAWSEEEIERAKKYGSIADLLHTDLHEVIGHASGIVNEGVGTPKETLKNYASTLEEGRADLVALYFLYDQKLVDMGLVESLDAGKVAYDDYIKNGMMLQLKRLKPGEQIEEDHMRNRQLIAKWAYEAGMEDSVIVKKKRDGKTYFVVQDYAKLKDIFGMQLRELQRIKSEGDFEAGQKLVETYGVKVDPELHQEVLDRYSTLDIAPYGGFINPVLKPVMEGDKIVDVKVEYPMSFVEQMLYYGNNYSFISVK